MILKFSTQPESFHPFAFNEGILNITDGMENTVVIHPCCGVLDVYYMIGLLLDGGDEMNYCVEEYFTKSQYDDEYCITLKRIVAENMLYLEIKQNNHDRAYIYEFLPFFKSLIQYSEEIVDLFTNLSVEYELPFVILIKDRINEAKTAIEIY